MGNPDKPFCLTGLSAAQVQQKKESGKQNLPPEKSTKSTSQILKDNICTLFNLFNVLIAIALALVGAWSNMMFICIIAVNTLIGIVQELHAKKLVEKLSLLSAPTVRVIRDGSIRKSLSMSWWSRTSSNWKRETKSAPTALYW